MSETKESSDETSLELYKSQQIYRIMKEREMGHKKHQSGFVLCSEHTKQLISILEQLNPDTKFVQFNDDTVPYSKSVFPTDYSCLISSDPYWKKIYRKKNKFPTD